MDFKSGPEISLDDIKTCNDLSGVDLLLIHMMIRELVCCSQIQMLISHLELVLLDLLSRSKSGKLTTQWCEGELGFKEQYLGMESLLH